MKDFFAYIGIGLVIAMIFCFKVNDKFQEVMVGLPFFAVFGTRIILLILFALIWPLLILSEIYEWMKSKNQP